MFETSPETRIFQFAHNPTKILLREYIYRIYKIFLSGRRDFIIFPVIMVDLNFNNNIHVGKKCILVKKISTTLQRTFIMDLLNFISLSWQIQFSSTMANLNTHSRPRLSAKNPSDLHNARLRRVF